MSTKVQTRRFCFAFVPALALAACTVDSTDPAATGTAGTPSVLPPSTAGSAGTPAAAATAGSSGSINPGTSGAPTMSSGGGGAGPGSEPGAGSPAVAGSAGSAGVGGAPAGPGNSMKHGMTAGCGKPVNDMAGKDVLHNIMVKGVARRYWTKLPSNYDPSMPTPLVFYGPGCGASGVEGAPLDAAIKDSAMRVFVIGTGGCFDTGGPEPETGYFNAVLDEVQANFCTDPAEVFVSGYSSGAWLSMLLSCTAGDRIRAIGTAAGGFRADNPPCKGNPAAMFHAGTGDGANPITKMNKDGVNEGSSAGRDRLIKANGCTTETKEWDPKYPYCKEYVGCSSPVIWCEQAVGHSNGEEVGRTGWWKFWSSLP